MSRTLPMFWILFLAILVAPGLAQPPAPNGFGSDSLLPRPERRQRRRSCRELRRRTIDGLCTTTGDSTFGMARFPQASYTNTNSSEPTGATLKSAREISNIIFDQEGDVPNNRGINQLFVSFGQFLDHNLIATPVEGGERFDIPVPEDDMHVAEVSMPFSRSRRAQVLNTSVVRPLNTLTSSVDLVAVYGPDQLTRTDDLQEFENGLPTGKLRVSGPDLLPRNTGTLLNAPDASADFFVAGDHRCNEHPVLTSIHTLFLREHNRLADVIKERIPGLSGSTIFDYARTLNIVQFQKIVFDEFFPTIIGSKLPPYENFNNQVNPTVTDLFTGAAYRIGHTMVAPDVPRISRSGPIASIPMEEAFFRTADTFNVSEFESILRGAANNLAQEVDIRVVDTLRNQLFEKTSIPDAPFDLVAINIQRGRDHALPKYNEIREVFGFQRKPSFSDISSDSATVARLASAYDNVDDVEAFPGLLAEDHIPNSSVGETMAAIWVAEFQRLRDGDQFFYLRGKAVPVALRVHFKRFLKNLRTGTGSAFREIILRNTDISSFEMPSDNVFTIQATNSSSLLL